MKRRPRITYVYLDEQHKPIKVQQLYYDNSEYNRRMEMIRRLKAMRSAVKHSNLLGIDKGAILTNVISMFAGKLIG